MLPPLSPGLATSPPPLGAASMDLASHGRQDANQAPRKMAKAHVPSACLNCKRAHLACDGMLLPPVDARVRLAFD